MDCRQCQELLDDLLVAEPTPAQRASLIQHTETCPECARQYQLANQVLAAMTPVAPLFNSAEFKERVMSAISDARLLRPRLQKIQGPRDRVKKLLAVVSVAAMLLVVVTSLFRIGSGPDEQGFRDRFSAFSLLSEACAAERTLFTGKEIVHFVNEITVVPVADPTLAKSRWFPMVSLDATGKPHFQQLTLGLEPGKGCTIKDESWYDPTTGRYTRVMTAAGKPIFATAFDGSQVYDLEIPATGTPRVVNQAISNDFQPPKSPAEFLGISTGLESKVDRKDKSLVRDVGKTILEDGSEAHQLKLGMPTDGGPKDAVESYSLMTIRADNNRIEKMELNVNGQTMYVIRRGKSVPGEKPTSDWNLAGIAQQAAGNAPALGLGIIANMVILDVSVEHMATKSDFATYVFANDPAWAGDRTITDVLDPPSPSHRMFVITYRGKDGRHVVLVQSHTFNQKLGKLTEAAKLVYTSRDGVKVWSGERDQWMAKILLQSARAAIKDPPAKEITGYLLETPAGTYPALAINGSVTEEELHALIDSLVPAKKQAEE